LSGNGAGQLERCRRSDQFSAVFEQMFDRLPKCDTIVESTLETGSGKQVARASAVSDWEFSVGV